MITPCVAKLSFNVFLLQEALQILSYTVWNLKSVILSTIWALHFPLVLAWNPAESHNVLSNSPTDSKAHHYILYSCIFPWSYKFIRHINCSPRHCEQQLNQNFCYWIACHPSRLYSSFFPTYALSFPPMTDYTFLIVLASCSLYQFILIRIKLNYGK